MRTIKQRILCSASLAAFAMAGLATPAYAQDDPPAAAPAAADDEEAIVVTGSRIPQPNLTAVSPVTVVNSQDIRLQGTTRTEDLINSLPQAFGDQGSNLANGASGTATVNLRGLGPNRNLVLIDGRRAQPANATLTVDVNSIPAAAIANVEIISGGASSVYGADAIAGVVNF
ncbi:MAG TPA: TonB-dependent receptor plug domain-containing protein, partial [Rhizomicrobium sp.]